MSYNSSHALRIANGLCVNCGMRPAPESLRKCDECRALTVKMERRRRAAVILKKLRAERQIKPEAPVVPIDLSDLERSGKPLLVRGQRGCVIGSAR